MTNFEGKRFFCDGEETTQDCWGHSVTKPTFKMTRSYYKYLLEKEQKERELELLSLKSKLDYQMKTYGEVDPIDYASYLNQLEEYQKIEVNKRNDVKLSEKSKEIISAYNNRY